MYFGDYVRIVVGYYVVVFWCQSQFVGLFQLVVFEQGSDVFGQLVWFVWQSGIMCYVVQQLQVCWLFLCMGLLLQVGEGFGVGQFFVLVYFVYYYQIVELLLYVWLLQDSDIRFQFGICGQYLYLLVINEMVGCYEVIIEFFDLDGIVWLELVQV